MRFCSCCVTGSHFCFVSEELNKCKHCIQLSHSCNLIISLVKLNCINEELQQLCEEKRRLKIKAVEEKLKLIIKKERFYKQIALLMKHQLSLIDTELHNIEELKVKKCVQAEVLISSTDSSKSSRVENFNLILILFN